MSGQRVHTKTSKNLNRLERAHPLTLIFNLLSLVCAAFFVYLVATIWAIDDQFSVPLNREVLYALFALIIPVYFIRDIPREFKNENARRIVLKLIASVIALGTFLFFQKQAWTQIIELEPSRQSLPDKVFLLIVAIHSIIVFGLLLKMCYLAGHFSKTISSEVKSLLIFTNPFEEMRLRLLTRALVFVQFAWVLSYLLMLGFAS